MLLYPYERFSPAPGTFQMPLQAGLHEIFEKNRIQNCMTVSNVDIASILSDPFSQTATEIMSYLLEHTADSVDETAVRKLIKRERKQNLMKSSRRSRTKSSLILQSSMAESRNATDTRKQLLQYFLYNTYS